MTITKQDQMLRDRLNNLFTSATEKNTKINKSLLFKTLRSEYPGINPFPSNTKLEKWIQEFYTNNRYNNISNWKTICDSIEDPKEKIEFLINTKSQISNNTANIILENHKNSIEACNDLVMNQNDIDEYIKFIEFEYDYELHPSNKKVKNLDLNKLFSDWNKSNGVVYNPTIGVYEDLNAKQKSSSAEIEIAEFMNSLGIKWISGASFVKKYGTFEYKNTKDNSTRTYTPDFYVEKYNLIIDPTSKYLETYKESCGIVEHMKKSKYRYVYGSTEHIKKEINKIVKAYDNKNKVVKSKISNKKKIATKN